MKFANFRSFLGSKMATKTSSNAGDFKLTTNTNPNFTITTGTGTATDSTNIPFIGVPNFNGFNATVHHNDIDTVKTHVQIAPNVYLKIIDEGGRAIFHLCENLEGLPTGEKDLAGEFLPEHYDKVGKDGKWAYYNYKCNKCGVQIPNELVNKSDVIGMLAKFKTKNG